MQVYPHLVKTNWCIFASTYFVHSNSCVCCFAWESVCHWSIYFCAWSFYMSLPRGCVEMGIFQGATNNFFMDTVKSLRVGSLSSMI
jgi:hypothetical protein